MIFLFFFFNDTATTEIYTLSLHDALPIYLRVGGHVDGFDEDVADRYAGDGELAIGVAPRRILALIGEAGHPDVGIRSEEHTSELQSRLHLVCRLLLEKKKRRTNTTNTTQT